MSDEFKENADTTVETTPEASEPPEQTAEASAVEIPEDNAGKLDDEISENREDWSKTLEEETKWLEKLEEDNEQIAQAGGNTPEIQDEEEIKKELIKVGENNYDDTMTELGNKPDDGVSQDDINKARVAQYELDTLKKDIENGVEIPEDNWNNPMTDNRKEWLKRLEEADEKITQAGEGTPELQEAMAYQEDLHKELGIAAEANFVHKKEELLETSQEAFYKGDVKASQDAIDNAQIAARELEMIKKDIAQNKEKRR